MVSLMNRSLNLKPFKEIIQKTRTLKVCGKVKNIIGTVIEATGLRGSIGTLCYIKKENDDSFLPAEIVGFRETLTLLMPLGDMMGIQPASIIYSTDDCFKIKTGNQLIGRVLDGLGNPIDENGDILCTGRINTTAKPPSPLTRTRISEILSCGVRAIDTTLTIGKGQRMGIFAGSGVGKSTLMGMIARYTSADVNVIALVGERGREVLEFIEKDLKKEGLRRSVVVASTSDQPALIRIKAASVATSIAEFFREQGKDVLLMMDSLTRIAQAQREVGLSIGEPPTTKGYTPSVFALFPQLLERSGNSAKGSITGLYTILVEGDDLNEPISDAARSILDGHIVLSRDLTSKNHYPPIDVINSISRLMIDITDKEHYQKAHKIRQILSSYKEAEDLINIGAYVKGSNPKIDYAISMIDRTNDFLKQDINENSHFADSISRLKKLIED